MRQLIFFLAIFIFSSLSVSNATAQITISGTITDASGQALTGATIAIKDSAYQTISDFDGQYSLCFPKQDEPVILEISCLAYRPRYKRIDTSAIGVAQTLNFKLLKGEQKAKIIVNQNSMPQSGS